MKGFSNAGSREAKRSFPGFFSNPAWDNSPLKPKNNEAIKDETKSKPSGVRPCKLSLKAVLMLDQAIIESPAKR